MEVSARHRFEMHQELKKVLGDTVADTLMEHLPPNGWSDVVRLGDLTPIYARFDSLEARFERIEARFESNDARFKSIDARFESIDARFKNIDRQFALVDERFVEVNRRLDRLENTTRMLIGLSVTVLLGVIGLLFQGM